MRDRIVDLATGRGREDFKYVYSFPEGKLDRMHRGDLDGKALVQLRERWFRILAKTEYRHEEYKKYISEGDDGASNSQGREQLHSILDRMAPSLRQMSYHNFMRSLIVFFSVRNLIIMNKI